MPSADERRRRAIRGADRFLNAWHGGPTAAEQLQTIVDATGAGERRDHYGSGERIERLETRSRRAPRQGGRGVHADGDDGPADRRPDLVRPPREPAPSRSIRRATSSSTRSTPTPVSTDSTAGSSGIPNALITLEDLEAIHEPVAVLLLELPQREIGGRLPDWDDLVAQTAWARDRKVALHLDGARLWEAQPFYSRAHAKIAALFDSVYVSFYKGLGGMAGAALASDADTIAEARIWLRRHGGNLVTMHPYVVAAELALDERLARMPEYVAHARAVAGALAGVDGVEVVPNPPQTPLFHLLLRGQRDRLADAALAVAEERKVFLFADPGPTTSPSWQRHEVHVGDSTLALAPAEVAELYAEVLERAAAPRRARKRGTKRSS